MEIQPLGYNSGTVSQIAGGKFANGAVTGAFTYLFNYKAHEGYMKRALYQDQSYRTRQENAVNMFDKSSTFIEMAAGATLKRNPSLSIRLYGLSKSLTVMKHLVSPDPIRIEDLFNDLLRKPEIFKIIEPTEAKEK